MNKTVIPLVCLFLLACPKRGQVSPTSPTNATQGLEQALLALEARRYKEAEKQFTYIIFNFPGTREAADAQYYLGETYFQAGDYTQAQTEFDFYLKSFPNGQFQEEAEYKLGLAYLRAAPGGNRDQSLLLKAREKFEDFLSMYPDSKLRPQVESSLSEVARRIAARDFSTALLYYRAGEFRSALTYYEYLQSQISLEQWSGEDKLRLGICYQETGQPLKARSLFSELLSGDFSPQLKKVAALRLARLSLDTLPH